MHVKEARELPIGTEARRLVTVTHDSTIKHALDVMRESKIHHLVVLRNGKLAGIVTAKELIAEHIGDDWFASGRVSTVSEIMRMNIPIIDESTDVKTALSLMLQKGITGLPLVRNGKPIGVITETDMLRLLDYLIHRQAKRPSVIALAESAASNPLLQTVMKVLGDAGV